MRVITAISALTLTASVAGLDSSWPWGGALALALGALSLAVLFHGCGRLGLFSSGRAHGRAPENECKVIELHRGQVDRAPGLEPGPGFRRRAAL